MLSRSSVRAIYDRVGEKLDRWQRHSDPAVDALIAAGSFPDARAVFELGCGTGRFAEKLLALHLPTTAAYTAVDLSPTMVRVARQRLDRFGARVAVHLTDGSPRLGAAAGAFDRFVCMYVLDLMPDHEIREVLEEARRVLVPQGLLCLLCLTRGSGRVSRLVSRTWGALSAVRPALTGGCRPIDLLEYVREPWRIRRAEVISRLGVSSQMLVAERPA
jgi:ubiquinone/menaquinone biosynthesis C-methylase UbiE